MAVCADAVLGPQQRGGVLLAPLPTCGLASDEVQGPAHAMTVRPPTRYYRLKGPQTIGTMEDGRHLAPFARPA